MQPRCAPTSPTLPRSRERYGEPMSCSSERSPRSIGGHGGSRCCRPQFSIQQPTPACLWSSSSKTSTSTDRSTDRSMSATRWRRRRDLGAATVRLSTEPSAEGHTWHVPYARLRGRTQRLCNRVRQRLDPARRCVLDPARRSSDRWCSVTPWPTSICCRASLSVPPPSDSGGRPCRRPQSVLVMAPVSAPCTSLAYLPSTPVV